MGMSAFFDEAIEAERAKRDAQAKRDRRERIATKMLAGLMSNPATQFDYQEARHRSEIARVALVMADSLIAALDAEGGDGVA